MISLKYSLLVIILLVLEFSINNVSGQVSTTKTPSYELKKRAQYYIKEGHSLVNMKEYKRAAMAFVKSYQAISTSREAAFNAARCFAMANDTGNTVKYSRAAVKLGAYNFDGNKDFKLIRGILAFENIVKEANGKITEIAKEPIEPVVILPPGYSGDEKLPLIVALHGYNDNPSKYARNYRGVARKFNAILLLIRGSKIVGEKSFAWTYETDEYDRIYYDIDSIKNAYNIDESKVILTGFSQGAYLTLSFGTIHSNLFKGLLPIVGRVPKNIDVSNIKNKNIRIFSIIGTKDRMVYRSENTNAQKQFTANGIQFQLKKFYMGHEFPDNKDIVLTEAITWLLAKE